ncbi:MAG: glycosyltransferase [Faecalibacterium sp.]
MTTLNVVRLAKNGGLGNALNEGIKHCKNELVARMDSDDIAYPDRCEKQIAAFNAAFRSEYLLRHRGGVYY